MMSKYECSIGTTFIFGKFEYTSGVFKSFHQGWGGRTQTALERIESFIVLPELCFCEIGDLKRPVAEMWCVDAQHLANQMSGFEVDVAYLDPPYNQHAYSSNYHVSMP